MATKFAMATNKKLNLKTWMHDVDGGGLELMQEVAALNIEHGLTMADWEFTRRDYKGDEIGKYDWKNEPVTVKLGDLFS